MKKHQFKIIRIGEPAPTCKCEVPENAIKYWHEKIAKTDFFDSEKETLVVICLNAKLNVIGHNIVSIGTINETIAHPRDIMRPVIINNSYGFIMMHNHPSGETIPSRTDLDFTLKFREAANMFQVVFLDHVIVGNGEKYYSFKESGYL